MLPPHFTRPSAPRRGFTLIELLVVIAIIGVLIVLRTHPRIGQIGCDFGQEFHSYHPSGAQFLFADGSARFLKETIEPQVLAALLARKGGEIVSADDF